MAEGVVWAQAQARAFTRWYRPTGVDVGARSVRAGIASGFYRSKPGAHDQMESWCQRWHVFIEGTNGVEIAASKWAESLDEAMKAAEGMLRQLGAQIEDGGAAVVEEGADCGS